MATTTGQQVKPGDRVTKGRLTGEVLELRDTPHGTSAKVKMDQRKIASWYWAADLAPEGE